MIEDEVEAMMAGRGFPLLPFSAGMWPGQLSIRIGQVCELRVVRSWLSTAVV